MQKSSWIVLGVVIILTSLLGMGYVLSRSDPPKLNKEQAEAMLEKMRVAVEKKEVNTIMEAIAPGKDIKISDVNPEQLRYRLASAFRNTEKLNVDISKVEFQGGEEQANLSFDVVVKSAATGMQTDLYQGRITVELKRVEVSRMLGLSKSQEWRIVGAQTTGPTPGSWGDI